MFDRSSRIQRVRKGLDFDQLEALLITDLSNIYYLSGFRGSDGALYLTPEESTLLVDGRYGAQAKDQAPDCNVEIYSKKLPAISKAIKSSKAKTIGFEAGSMTVSVYQALMEKTKGTIWKPVSDWYAEIRAVKDDQEQKLLRHANQVVDESFHEVLPLIREGITEQDIAVELEYRMQKKGAEDVSFPILVASGERSALPHALPTSKKLKKGEICFVDFGGIFDGYHTDQTVPFCIGDPDPKWEKIHSIVKEAHDRAIDAVCDNVKCAELDLIAREYIQKNGFGDYFNHSVGHGVGVDVHEYPRLSPGSSCMLKTGMTFTIEPGIYIPNQGGIRIEDTLLLTDRGVEFLTSIDKALMKL